MIQVHISRQPVGYIYWTTMATRMGVRHVGAEMRCVMDDFGNLVAMEPKWP